MTKLQGFKLRKQLILLSRWFRRSTRPARYQRLTKENRPPPEPAKTLSKILSWSRQLIFLWPAGRSDRENRANPIRVPKGHLAVYVGGKYNRILVPVVYFNHRPFVELLREAEEEYGFQHEKGITLPCGYSEFERIRTRIRNCRRTRSSGSCCFFDGGDEVWRLGT